MITVRFSRLLYVGLLLLLTACQAALSSMSDTMLEPGDVINGMILTTGAKDAPPLWAFCSPAQGTGNTIAFDCKLSVLPKLGIGDLFMLVRGRSSDASWSDLHWQLSLDDQPLDLKAFGTFDYVMPVMPQKPSPMAEIFKKSTAWDIVLANLIPGEYRLQGLVQTQSGSYTLVIHLTINAKTVLGGMSRLKAGLYERP